MREGKLSEFHQTHQANSLYREECIIEACIISEAKRKR